MICRKALETQDLKILICSEMETQDLKILIRKTLETQDLKIWIAKPCYPEPRTLQL